MFVMYTIMCFSQWVQSVEIKLKIGYFSCSLVALHFIINLGIIFGDSLKGIIRKRRFNFLEKKHKKQRDGLRCRLEATHNSRWVRILELQQEHIQKEMAEEVDSGSILENSA